MPQFIRYRFRRAAILFTLIVLLFSSMPHHVEASAGDLDVTFGVGGKVTTDFFGNSDEVRGVVLQPDGKLVTVGFVYNTLTQGDFGLARYEKNGTLDTSFGSGGKVSTDLSQFPTFASSDGANAVSLQADGKIVVAGSSSFGSARFALARYGIDGSLDSGFSSGGTVTTSFSRFDAAANGVAIQPDGKIIAVGFTNTSFVGLAFNPDFALARYNTDGSLDSTFGVGGKVTTDFNGLGDVASGVAIQGDGRIVVVGSSQVTPLAPEVTQFSIARYNTDGTLDLTFGIGGKVRPFFFGQFDQANALALLPDGKIIVAGVVSNFNLLSASDFGMIRLNTDGSTDTTFGSNGKVTTDFSSEFDSAHAIAIQPNGKIILVGVVSKVGISQNSTDFAIARYNSDGGLDATFGSAGKVTTDFFGFSNSANAVVIQQDGRIIAAGRANSGIIGDFAVARYNGDGDIFDICIQDETNPRNFVSLNSHTGDYNFYCGGVSVAAGRGTLNTKGGIGSIEHVKGDRRVYIEWDTTAQGGKGAGTAILQNPPNNTRCQIIDKDMTNNNCTASSPVTAPRKRDASQISVSN